MNPGIESAKVYTDFSGFEAMRTAARNEQQQALPEVAKQFEAVFLQMVVKSMRQANNSFSKDGFFNNDSIGFYQDMFDQQLSLSLTGGQGIGLANVLVRQLGKNQAMTNPIKENESSASDLLATIKKQINQSQQLKTQGSQMSEASTKITGSNTLFENPIDFIKSLLPYAQKIAQAIGLDPKMLIAQAALETGWGKSIIQDEQGHSSHNLFNIKAGGNWQQDRVAVSTTEYEQGKAVEREEPFRKYTSFEDSFNDYIKLLKTHTRYDAALQNTHDAKAYIQALQDAGYATDPAYANKVYSIYNSDVLNKALIGMKDDG